MAGGDLLYVLSVPEGTQALPQQRAAPVGQPQPAAEAAEPQARPAEPMQLDEPSSSCSSAGPTVDGCSSFMKPLQALWIVVQTALEDAGLIITQACDAVSVCWHTESTW